MIKATGGTQDGTPLLILGLSLMNMRKLLKGQPIPVHTQEVDPRHPAMHIVIMGGATEEAIATELEQYERGPDEPNQ